jgi:hypothetical protein
MAAGPAPIRIDAPWVIPHSGEPEIFLGVHRARRSGVLLPCPDGDAASKQAQGALDSLVTDRARRVTKRMISREQTGSYRERVRRYRCPSRGKPATPARWTMATFIATCPASSPCLPWASGPTS